ncbi:UNVERIFIED_CONTAM: PDZ domain-containing protein 8 [Siphonaria sp. JEL0065]|nr:PDZ domain-containing protein 8 [Siphonaria sp. JEL0065]
MNILPLLTASQDTWLRGLLFGAGLVLTLQFLVIVGACVVLFDPLRESVPVPKELMQLPTKALEAEAEKEKEKEGAWPKATVAFLEAALASSPGGGSPSGSNQRDQKDESDWDTLNATFGPTDAAPWLNVVVARFFLSLRDSTLFTDKLCLKLMQRLNAKLVNNQNMFVSHVRLHDLSLGDNVPKVLAVRMLKGLTDDLAVAMEVDVAYEGGASVGIEPTLTRGQPIPVRVSINSLRGKLRVRVPAIGYSDMFSVSFLEDPGVSFKVEAPTITVGDNDIVRGMVSSVISEIIRRVFLDMWVLPAWRTFFLPLMIPSAEEESARMDEVNRNSKEAKAGTPSISKVPKAPEYFAKVRSKRFPELHPPPPVATTSSTTSATQQSVLKPFDVVDSTTFPTATILDSTSIGVLPVLENALVKTFNSLTQEVANRNNNLVLGPNGTATLVNSNSDWKTVKSSSGIVVRKCTKRMDGFANADVNWASVNINCDAERVFVILSNPEYMRHVEISYVESVILKQFDESRSVRQSTFKLGKSGLKSYTVFEVLKRIPAPSAATTDDDFEPCPLDSYLILARSVAAFKEDEDDNDGSVLDLQDKPGGSVADAHSPSASSSASAVEQQQQQQSRSGSPTRAPTATPAAKVLERTNTNSSRNQTPEPTKTATSGAPPSPTKKAAAMLLETAATIAAQAAAPILPPSRKSSLPATATSASLCTVYMQGFLIEPTPTDPNTCTVTIISMLSADLKGLETNFATCKKLKSFVEEYISHVDGNLYGNGSGSVVEASGAAGETRKKIGEALVDYATKGQELKNYFASTASSYLKSGKMKGWSNAASGAGAFAPSGSFSSAAGVASGGADFLGEEDGESSEYEDTATEFVNVKARGFDAEQATLVSRSATEASSGSTGSSSRVAQQMKQGVDLVASMAKTMKRPPSIGFITRAVTVAAGGVNQGIQQATTGEEEWDSSSSTGKRSKSGSIPPSEPFLIGTGPDPSLFVAKRVLGKDIVKEEVVFRREEFRDAAELSWEFVLKPDQSIVFGVTFRPFNSGDSSGRDLSYLFPGSISEYGTRQVIPLASVTTSLIPTCRGNLCLSSFGSGTFVFSWDNTNGSKKQEKEFSFRSLVRAFEVPRPSPSLMSSLVRGEFGFDRFGRGQHNTGMVGEVTINRKSLYRVCLPYDQSLESFNNEGEAETCTYLAWDFSTNGLDVLFGVYYYAAVETGGGYQAPPQAPPSHPLVQKSSPGMDEVFGAVGGELIDLDESSTRTEESVKAETNTASEKETAPKAPPTAPPAKPTRKTLQPSPQSTSVPVSPTPSAGKLSLAARLEAVAAREHHVLGATDSSTSIDSSSKPPVPAGDAGSSSSSNSTTSTAPHSRQGSSSLFANRPVAVPIIPLAKVKTNVGATQSGTLAVTGMGNKKGVYAFVWDNTASVMLPKIVSFRVGLVTSVVATSTTARKHQQSEERQLASHIQEVEKVEPLIDLTPEVHVVATRRLETASGAASVGTVEPAAVLGGENPWA